jgi:uncharacterized membrane protein YccC
MTLTGAPFLTDALPRLVSALRLDFLAPKTRTAFLFALRSCLASMLALFLAFFLQLDEPYWAGLAVWMVAQPRPGMATSKSFYRIVGTVAGSAIGVVLVALFPQQPELFILTLALWIGGCTIASNLLRNFRAYGTVLAGYTAAIVALGAIDTPDQVFNIAMARASATIIGIVSAGLITALFAQHEAAPQVRLRLRAAIARAGERGAFPLHGCVRDRIALGRPLVAELVALDTEIEFAAAESAGFRIHADLARSLLAHLFSAIASRRSLEDHLLREGPIQSRATTALFEETMALLRSAPELLARDAWSELEQKIAALRERITAQAPEEESLSAATAISSRVTLDRLDDLLRDYGRAVHDWPELQEPWKREASLRLNFHRDHRAALINGVRATLAVLAAGAFWIASAWSSGSAMLIYVGVGSSLFSAAPRPDAQALSFLQGGVLAMAMAFIAVFFVLPFVTGFALLTLVFCLFLLPGAMMFLHPRYSGIGLAYCVNFFGIARPLNPMSYDVVSFFNNGLAIIIGVGFGVVAFQLFLPPNRQAARSYAVYRIRRGLEIITRLEPPPPAWAWQTRMFDRVDRLYDPENPSGTSTDEWFESGLAALNLGSELLRLRALVEERPEAEITEPMRPVLESFAHFLHVPGHAPGAIRDANEALRRLPSPRSEPERRTRFRLLGVLGEMEAFFAEYPNFLMAR